MWRDSIVKEAREVREARAAKFKYDIRAMVKDAQKRQEESRRRLVSFAVGKRKTS